MSEFVATRTLDIGGKTYHAGDAVPASRLGVRLKQQLESQRKIVPLTKDTAKEGRRKV